MGEVCLLCVGQSSTLVRRVNSLLGRRVAIVRLFAVLPDDAFSDSERVRRAPSVRRALLSFPCILRARRKNLRFFWARPQVQ